MDTLHALDALITELAATLHASSPLPGWQQVTLFAKVAPDGSMAGYDYDYLLADGSVNPRVRHQTPILDAFPASASMKSTS
jgi:hypothetical protein